MYREQAIYLLKLLIPVLLSGLLPSVAYSQNHIEGIITDTSGHPIQGASINVVNDDIVLEFCLSDNKGKFNLFVNVISSQLNLEISHIGFSTIHTKIDNKSQSTKFTLLPANIILPAIRIQSAIPILQKSDTIIYDPKVFGDKQDRSIGDVIRKLPGIEVNSGGQISYNGKPISHYYIEGLDMLESRYNLANDNIQYADVEKIQILEHHQDKKILDSSEAGRSPAINLKLTAAAKNKIISTVEAGTGLGKNLLYHAAGTMMQFASARQFLLGIKADNAGTNIGRETEEHQVNTDILKNPSLSESRSDLLYINKPATPDIQEPYYLFNHSLIAHLNSLIVLAKSSQLKYNFSFLKNRINRNSSAITAISFPNDTISIKETQQHVAEQNIINAKFKFIKNSSHIFISNELKGTADIGREYGNTINDSIVNEKLKTPYYYCSNNLVVYRTLKKLLIQITSYTSFKRSPQKLDILPGQFKEFFNDDAGYQRLTQYATKKSLVTNNALSTTTRLFRFQQKYRVGFEHTDTRLASYLEKEVHNVSIPMNELFRNNFRQQETRFTPQIDLNYYRSWINISLHFPVEFLNLVRTDINKEFTTKNRFTFFLPGCNITKNLGRYYELNMNAGIETKTGGIDRNTQGYIMTNYRSVIRNDSLLYLLKSRYLGISLTYRNTVKGLFCYLLAFQSTNNENLMYNQDFSGILLEKKSMPVSNNSITNSLLLTSSKYISNIKLSVSANVNLMNSKSYLFQDNLIQTVKNNALTVSGRLILKKIKTMYFENNSSFTVATSKIVNGNYDDRFRNFNTSLAYYYFLSKEIIFNCSFYYYSTGGKSISTKDYLFINAGASYRTKRYEWILKLNNLSNIKEFTSQEITQNYSSRYTYQLRPATLMIQFNVKL
ncbi:MAG: hypothetical protein JST81_10250 [Bacteroidetes bacterium]|nr:hypothetical protein [Bacteroidota bacterium]